MSLAEQVTDLVKKTREASFVLASQSSTVKNQVLKSVASAIKDKAHFLKEENAKDLAYARELNMPASKIDRLTLSDKVLAEMAASLEEVAALPDPVGEIVKMWPRPTGITVGRMRIPLGVIGIIYESRPNVTSEAASLCLKSGNAVVLRGGSEAFHSNRAIAQLFADALAEAGLPPAAVSLIPVTDREAIEVMLSLEDYIDVIIPRGGEDLIRKVVAQSKIPVIKHYKGVCHIFVDRNADLDMARAVSINAKAQRPAVCNSMETLLIHKDVAERFVPDIVSAMQEANVEIRGCPEIKKLAPQVKEASEEDWPAEYLDLILAVKVVADIDEAIEHIRKYGSLHTESIITQDYAQAQYFINEVNSSSVMVNASTRFSDGFQYGLGAEIGISTTKLHAYGPMGLAELTTTKFIVFGQGQIRQ